MENVIHEAADIFPLQEESVAELAEDIRANGLLVPIERFDGKVIDGRRRLRACELAGVTPVFKDVSPADPVAYVLSLNLHRRHLSQGQRAMVAARAGALREKLEAEAKERMRRGGKAAGKGRPTQGVEPVPHPVESTGKTRDQLADLVGVTGRAVDYAAKVLADAVPEVIRAVDEGRLGVRPAAELTTEPEDVQRNAAAAPPRKPRKPKSKDEDAPPPGTVRGVGIELANEAINCLIRIPKTDPLRERGFQTVADWIRRNK